MSAKTGVDALAIAMGTSHGAYKFSRQPDGDILALDVVREIHARLPNTHLVMHGSSSVPQELQEAFNKFGGKMPQTWGVPLSEIQEGIRYGVRKVNIDTDCRLAMAAEFRRVAPKRRMSSIRANSSSPPWTRWPNCAATGSRRSAPRARRPASRPLPLAEMARRYASGSLKPAQTTIRQAA